MDNEAKYWWESRTVIAGLVAMLASALSLMGVEIPFSEQLILADIAFEMITLISGGVAVWGRVIATKKIVAPVTDNLK